MVMSFGPIIIGNTFGLYALLALIPFILAYLIRPRPRRLNVPSLMFFAKQSGFARLTSFLKNFVRDWLFIIQLLALLGLIFGLLSPFILYDHDVTSQNTVIVLDVSASSQALEDGASRLSIGISKAKDLLGSTNTVILAKEIPLIGIQDSPSSATSVYLDGVTPRETGTRLGDAIILAGEVLSGKEGRVIVISDFINTGGQNPETAKLVLEGRGLVVDFISTTAGTDYNNVGFVDLAVSDDSSVAYIKNFGKAQQTITITGPDFEKKITLPAGAAEPFNFITPRGVTELNIAEKDDFPVDNTIYVSGPPEVLTKVLMISNNKSRFLENALRASGFVDIEHAKPPIVSKEKFDLYVIHHLDYSEVLPGTMEDIKEQVDEGAAVVIQAQPGFDTYDYKGLLRGTVDGYGTRGPVSVDQTTRFTKNIDFGIVNQLPQFTPDGGTVIASVLDVPIMTLSNVGIGKSIYFGFDELDADFRLSPGYPIFWTELLKYLTNKQDLRSLNFRTGKTLILDKKQKIVTPIGTVQKSTLIIEEQGVYNLASGKLSANLLNEEESNIEPRAPIGQEAEEYELRPVTEQRQHSLEATLLAIAAVLLFLELVFIKWRGDV
jgi:hypothetical protein